MIGVPCISVRIKGRCDLADILVKEGRDGPDPQNQLYCNIFSNKFCVFTTVLSKILYHHCRVASPCRTVEMGFSILMCYILVDECLESHRSIYLLRFDNVCSSFAVLSAFLWSMQQEICRIGNSVLVSFCLTV